MFRSEGIQIVQTPYRAPKANAIAERFVRTIRGECLDRLLILNRRHLERVLRVFIEHYNGEGRTRALKLQHRNLRTTATSTTDTIQRHDRLGGLIHEYYRAHRLAPTRVRVALTAVPLDDEVMAPSF